MEVPAVTCFNPTMVRLLPKPKAQVKSKRKMFQSHNGAIAALLHHGHRARSVLFQSHNGAIAALTALMTTRGFASFQSHNGAIAALIVTMLNTIRSEFQSHNGEIAAVNDGDKCRRNSSVSIPQWCDCCPT